jgi:hypothetical protein
VALVGPHDSCSDTRWCTSRLVAPLERERLVWYGGREPYVVNAANQADKDTCVDHMRKWMHLSLAAIGAEFHCHEIAQAFRVSGAL